MGTGSGDEHTNGSMGLHDNVYWMGTWIALVVGIVMGWMVLLE
jgi:cell division protein FtsX